MTINFNLLDVSFVPLAKKLLEKTKEADLDCRPTSGYRSLEEQAKIWRRSRSSVEVSTECSLLQRIGADFLSLAIKAVGPQRMGPWGTNAIPGHSWHNWGQAMDCLLFREGKMIERGDDHAYKTYGSIAKDLGLRWGGDFKGKSVDAGHVQLNHKEVRDLYSTKEVNDHFEAIQK